MKSTLALVALLAVSTAVHAQDTDKAPALGKERAAELQAGERLLKADSQVSKTGQVTIKGKVVPYRVTAGTQPVWDKDGKADRARFFGVNADIQYLAEWVSTFVSREGRWTSPKYLIGESYGTTRVAGLALELQNA